MRIFVLVFCILLGSLLAVSVPARDVSASRIKVVAFDAFPIFDPRNIAKAAEEAFPGQGAKLWDAWRTRLFEYQWLRALGGRYEDFMATAEAALIHAAKQQGLELSAQKKARLLEEFGNLKPWPDAVATIKALRAQGLKLVFLSNMTEPMLRNGLRNAGIENEFTAVLSTDAIRTYKPDTKAYALAVEQLGVQKEEVLFVAFAGWDAAGAKWFGYPTYWVNRAGTPAEELGVSVDGESRDMAGLLAYVKANQTRE